MLQEENGLAQRAKCQWLYEGDKISRFFYNSIKATKSVNSRWSIDTSEKQAFNEELVESILYYKELYNQQHYRTESPLLVPRRMITGYANQLQMQDVSEEDVKAITMEAGLNKPPGTDGFSAKFFTLHREFLNGDFIAAIGK